MRKLLILVAVVVLVFAGCVDKEAAQTQAPEQEAAQGLSATQSHEPKAQETSSQSEWPADSESEIPDSGVSTTKETLEELGGLLEDLKDGDFADVEFAE